MMNAADISRLFEESTGQKAEIKSSSPMAAWPEIHGFLLTADPEQTVSAEDFMNSSSVSVATEFVSAAKGFDHNEKTGNEHHRCWKVSMKAGGVVYFLFHDMPILRDAISKIADPGPVSHFVGVAYFVPVEQALFLKPFDAYLRNIVVLSGLSSFNDMIEAMSSQAKACLEKLPESQRHFFIDKFLKSLANGLPALPATD